MEQGLSGMRSRQQEVVRLALPALQEEVTRTLQEFLESPERTVAAALRNQTESVLGRLESLQVLARQAPSPEGQQQIFALPVKVDGQWDEQEFLVVAPGRRIASSYDQWIVRSE